MLRSTQIIHSEVPEVVVLRLPLYARVLNQLIEDGTDVISSQQLGDLLQITPAQIRKDLSYFGKFGKQGRGYNIAFLLDELRHILGIDRGWRACLVGVGRLGRAIINYPGFSPEGFEIGEGMYFNKFVANNQIAMPQPLYEGSVDYDDGTEKDNESNDENDDGGDKTQDVRLNIV